MSFTTAPPLRYLKGAPRGRCDQCASLKPLPRSAAPFRGSGTKCRRGRQSSDTSRVKKTEPSIKRLSLRGAKRRGNPHPLTLYVKHTAVSRRSGFPRPVTSVTGLATAAYHDSLICRLVPLGGMTEGFLTVPCLFPNGTLYQLATPQSLRAGSPRRGAEGCGNNSAAPYARAAVMMDIW